LALAAQLQVHFSDSGNVFNSKVQIDGVGSSPISIAVYK